MRTDRTNHTKIRKHQKSASDLHLQPLRAGEDIDLVGGVPGVVGPTDVPEEHSPQAARECSVSAQC